MTGLTPLECAALAYIAEYLDDYGYGPSYDEIKVAIGASSKSAICRIVNRLVERRCVRRLPGKWRAIEVLRRPAPRSLSAYTPGDADAVIRAVLASPAGSCPAMERGRG